MISDTSRYIDNRVLLVSNPAGVARPTLMWESPADVEFFYTPYLWQDFDRIDYLAYHFLGDSNLWWIIANANPEILDWNGISVGTVIRIPNEEAIS